MRGGESIARLGVRAMPEEELRSPVAAERDRPQEPAALLVELCRQFYTQGWVSGTGGGVSLRAHGRIYVAPSGVQKERLRPGDIFEIDGEGRTLVAPPGGLKLSACLPLFMHAYRMRDAGAVLHSHSIHALMATLAFGREFRITHCEMIKGITGMGYRDELVVPIIENTDFECDLAGALAEAIAAYPKSHAVLVRRHGVYVWGADWVAAKTHAECYHYLFEAALRARTIGVDLSVPPRTPPA
jgi:methylthioribulose-1-phosphate dehydratase